MKTKKSHILPVTEDVFNRICYRLVLKDKEYVKYMVDFCPKEFDQVLNAAEVYIQKHKLHTMIKYKEDKYPYISF